MNFDATGAIYSAIDDLNAQSYREVPISKEPGTFLLKSDGIDSLDLVNLVVGIEEYIENKTGEVVVLVNESTMAAKNNPFETIGSLAAYIESILADIQQTD